MSESLQGLLTVTSYVWYDNIKTGSNTLMWTALISNGPRRMTVTKNARLFSEQARWLAVTGVLCTVQDLIKVVIKFLLFVKK